MQDSIENSLPTGVHMCLWPSGPYTVQGTKQRALVPWLMDDADSSEQNKSLFYRVYILVVETSIENNQIYNRKLG